MYIFRLFFERKFDFLPQEANNVNSMVYFLSAALSPFFGILIDKTGRNVTWVIISIVTTIGAHFMLAFTFFNPYIGVVRKYILFWCSFRVFFKYLSTLTLIIIFRLHLESHIPYWPVGFGLSWLWLYQNTSWGQHMECKHMFYNPTQWRSINYLHSTYILYTWYTMMFSFQMSSRSKYGLSHSDYSCRSNCW